MHTYLAKRRRHTYNRHPNVSDIALTLKQVTGSEPMQGSHTRARRDTEPPTQLMRSLNSHHSDQIWAREAVLSPAIYTSTRATRNWDNISITAAVRSFSLDNSPSSETWGKVGSWWFI